MSTPKFDLKSIRTGTDKSPKQYILQNEGLETAIQMAIWLGKPLLLTGAPGTGKTQLAFKVADMLHDTSKTSPDCSPFLDKPYIFNTKTTSTATDLFYNYDAVRHFQKKHIDEKAADAPASTAHPFIKMNALGNAILQSMGSRHILADPQLADLELLADFHKQVRPEPHSAVVLIDEIDKAPRDFPNDLLNEIENMEFYMSELMNKYIRKPENTNAQVLVIMTSNFEKALPDAFLRRCLFYHIPFPEEDELIRIVNARIRPFVESLNGGTGASGGTQGILTNFNNSVEALVKEFSGIRGLVKDKTPSTAELLEWIKTLLARGFFNRPVNFNALDDESRNMMRLAMPALAKSEADLTRLQEAYSL